MELRVLQKTLCDYRDIRLHLSTAYHPQTNGWVERTDEALETALRHFVGSDHRDWDSKLPFIEQQLQGTTPFALNRLTLPKNPFEAVVNCLADEEKERSPIKHGTVQWMGMSANALPSGQRTAAIAHSEYQVAKTCVERAKCRMKQTHDARGVTRRHLYQQGDHVWMSTLNLSKRSPRHPSKRSKLMPRFVGPFRY